MDTNPNLCNTVLIDWIPEIPIKVICFVWSAAMERIPITIGLSKRGVKLVDVNCGQCSNIEETVSHIFFKCPYAKTVWECIIRWCKIKLPHCESLEDILKFTRSWGHCPKKRKILVSICYGTIWWLWKARCEIFFKEIKIPPTKTADNIQGMVFILLKHRSSNYPIKWVDWNIYPFC
ncbi:unnamed protein product [Lactuca saligna]|uniref:Reverse transcriptase zinc-binding domain-containing protein n=1 Tax=Lactuca saligna TaxID=75948 RepID=A0AA35YEW0_LACSI|nr:unnamed protein product [Lactuca saligna]